MSGNTYRSLFRWNLFYHFISWTSGNITFVQLIYRAVVMPLIIVVIACAFGAALLYGVTLYAWVDGYNPKYMELPAWILWLRHSVGHEPSKLEDAVRPPPVTWHKPTQRNELDAVRDRATQALTPRFTANAHPNAHASEHVAIASTENQTPDAYSVEQPTNNRSRTYSEGTKGCDGDFNAREACLTARLADADALLNTEYKNVLRSLGTVAQLQLRHDERRWILERDNQCVRLVDSDDTACRLAMTIEHLTALRKYSVGLSQ